MTYSQPLKQLDLCSGVGVGFPLAAACTGGFNLTALAEIDPYCRVILSYRFPRTRIIGDIKQHDWGLESLNDPIDIITASPPCQPFSIQGKRQAADDERDCFPAVIRAIATLRPRYFCIENVPGLLNAPFRPGYEKGTYFGNLMWFLSESGFDAEWQTISSAHFGSPWYRERLLIVGISRSIKLRHEPRSWAEQIGESIKNVGSSEAGGGLQSGIPREFLQFATWLDRSTGYSIRLGVPSKDGVTRNRRAALGNALDPRVAGVALERVKYLDSLAVNF